MKNTMLFINSFQRNITFLCLFMMTGFIQAGQSTGHIQVKCEPGVSIFLDGNFIGDTEKEMGGLIIKDVTAGEHSLKAVKKTFEPQVETIKVSSGRVLTYTVKPFIPKIIITEEGETKQTEIKLQAGTLVIQSLPVECEISIPALGFSKTLKKKDKWTAEPIPSGIYRAAFKAMGKEIPYELEIETGHIRHLMVDFLSDEVKDLSKQKVIVRITAADPVTDIDGNVYQTIQIGEQVWMAENLKVTHYRNGDAIPTGLSDLEWENLNSGAYAVYENNEGNADTYGYLYNWYAVDDSRNIAPEGWHVPTDEEWMELEMALGMSESEANIITWRGTDQGSQLAGSANLWDDGYLENNAEFGTSGFNALPGGFRNFGGGGYDYMGLL